mgnify:CR=1 FL=1
MTKNELMGLLNISMLNCVRQRDRVDANMYPGEYAYYNGQFRAYETVVGMLATVDVSSIAADDARNFVGV